MQDFQYYMHIIRLHHSTMYLYAANCCRPCMVCRSVCRTVTVVSPEKKLLNRPRSRLGWGLR